MNNELLPCPFCGGKAEIERYGTPRQSTIYNCTECGCRLETGEEWGYTQWNKRVEFKDSKTNYRACDDNGSMSPLQGE